jgi:hypothetical protein
MKVLTFTGLLLLCLSGTKYRNTAPAGSGNGHKSTDTIFLLKERDTSYYHIVYVEKNRKSRWYKNLLDFKMHYGDSDEYHDNLEELKRHFKSFKKYNLDGLPKEWLPLNQYKGKYYIYYPSEWGMTDREVLTDSTLVWWTIEGPEPMEITSAKQINANTWHIGARYFYDGKPHPKNIIVHIINTTNQMAVWEYPDKSGLDRYELYIPRAYAAKFDMVVNYCDQGKMAEFMFDNIDFKALLKGKDISKK